MSLIQLDDGIFLDLTALGYVRFENVDDQPKAYLRFKDGASETLAGVPAQNLYPLLSGRVSEDDHVAGSQDAEAATDSGGHVPRPIRLGNLVINTALPGGRGRNKAWFYHKDENGREYFLAFVNAKGSCSIRTFDSEKGIFLGKHSQPGNYQDQFADLIAGATDVTVSSQPNLERDCKERLPDHLLAYLRKQIG
jgi:hypothetical protein